MTTPFTTKFENDLCFRCNEPEVGNGEVELTVAMLTVKYKTATAANGSFLVKLCWPCASELFCGSGKRVEEASQ